MAKQISMIWIDKNKKLRKLQNLKEILKKEKNQKKY